MAEKRYGDGPLASASHAEAVTPHNSNEVEEGGGLPRALYIGTGGDLAVKMADGGDVIFANVQDGTILDIQVRLVKSTGTTASDIIALY